MSNPFTGTPYNSWDDVDKDLKDHPWCKQKILDIAKRIGIVISHEEVRELCGMWGALNPKEFYDHFNNITDEQLKTDIEKLRKRHKRKNVGTDYITEEIAGVI